MLIAWSTNLVAKPLATVFGGTVASIGMLVALNSYQRNKPVLLTGIAGRLSGSTLAVLTAKNGHNEKVIQSAINNADGRPVVFLYVAERQPARTPHIFEVVDPYLEDAQAKRYFKEAASQAKRAGVQPRFVYRQQQPEVVAHIWQVVHPRDTVVAAELTPEITDINPDRIRYEITSDGKVAHLLKQW